MIPTPTELAVVDLEALGLVPQRQQGAAPTNGHRSPNGHREPAPPQIKMEFARLVAKLAIVLRRGGRELVRCTQHEDRTGSLTVDYDEAWLRCHSTSSGCPLEGTHGVGFLRQFLGEEPLPRARKRGSIANPGQGVRPQAIDPERERSRLVWAMKESGIGCVFDRTTERALWEDVRECHIAMVKRVCIDAGHQIAHPKSCGFPLCPICVPTRLRADFRRHEPNLPHRLALFIVAPPPGALGRPEVASWFRDWRRKSNLLAGFYGVRLCVDRPDVLLVIPADEVPAGIVSDLHATLVAADVSFEDAVAWYVEKFLEEVSSWRTPEEMVALLSAVKGRRRFQGFGKYYANRTVAKEVEDGQLFTEEPKKVYRASGGSAKGGSKALTCPICGSRTRVVGIALNADGMEWNSQYKCYLWGIGPPPKAIGNGSPSGTGASV